MNCVSISFRSADLSFRQKLAFSSDVQKQITAELLTDGHLSECVVLCTCNRTEVYFTADDSGFEKVVAILAKYSETEPSGLSKRLLFFTADKAIFHLFKVAAGIDSMVMGEDEILSQTKAAYLRTCEQNAVGYRLNMIFQAAFAAAKAIKTNTVLSKSSVSVATLAASAAAKLGNSVVVLVIGGSGQLGSTIIKNLTSHKNVRVLATLRRQYSLHAHDENGRVEWVDYRERYRYMKDCDCVISATSSPHYTVTSEDAKGCLADGKNRLLIDLAVPPDVEPSLSAISGITLLNIDHFRRLATENNLKKQSSAEAALDIISEYIDTLKKDFLYHDFRPVLPLVKENLGNDNIDVLIYQMKAQLSAAAFSEFIGVLRQFENR